MRDRSGFTLVELLVVVAIVAVLLALTVPALMTSLAVAEETTCQSNLRQLGMAELNYAADSSNTFSPWRYTIAINGSANGTSYNSKWYEPWWVRASLIWPYLSGGDRDTTVSSSDELSDTARVFVCPVFEGIVTSSAVSSLNARPPDNWNRKVGYSYAMNWNLGSGDAVGEQVTKLGMVRQPGQMTMFGDENAWTHPLYSGSGINDGQMTAAFWPRNPNGGYHDAWGSYHRPREERYNDPDISPGPYVPATEDDVIRNTGVAFCVFVDGHVQEVPIHLTEWYTHNDRSDMKHDNRP